MPSAYRRASAPLPRNHAVRGLVPLEEVLKERKTYGGMKSLRPQPYARVYTPVGTFAQAREAQLPTHIIEEERLAGQDESLDVEVDTQRREKNKRLWRTWSEETIPLLLRPYMELLEKTGGLRDMKSVWSERDCHGCSRGHLLTVTCVFFERLESLTLCTCTKPALQLLGRGLFPCAPSSPTLAVDVNVLDFTQHLFVNAAPNTTAWCETLEGFLSARKFKLKTRDSLRGRFGNAIRWYANLINTKNLLVQDYLDAVRDDILAPSNKSEDEDIEMDDIESDPLSDSNDTSGHMDSEPSSDSNDASGDRPSQYLRERCPLCFGGENWAKPDQLVDAIVCLDACFTQKRRKSQGTAWSPPHVHPQTVFVPEAEVKNMEEMVEGIRSTNPKANNKGKEKTLATPSAAAAEAETEVEPGMKVPVSVLDGCNDSFLAADEKRVKASTQFFADTGLMGLLCRHDRVLWLANMTSAGEKQHYALALIQKLFEHIPDTMRIGLLYDIGCQLHRSCVKHNFLPDYLDRIVFGISVFHAYGHQWACQMVYHPRKCEGFGLTDGEGCERFWSLIKSLIPSCRVSGFYTRIYTIDTKIKQLDNNSLFGLGTWLLKKWRLMEEKKLRAMLVLEDTVKKGYTMEYLRKQWIDQIAEQTKPLPKQSKNLANKIIEEIMVLTRNLELYTKEESDLETMLETGDYEEHLSALGVEELLGVLREKITKTRKAIGQKRGGLSVDGRLSLAKLVGNQFLQTRMNALAIKQRIRDKLRARKFEIEALERSYRSSVNQAKLEKHAQQQIKKKEPGIQSLARSYNKLCEELEVLHKQKKAPRGATIPLPIMTTGLFKLDVDDDIWEDVGLTDSHDDSTEIPDWLANETVRNGIKALLEYDRCVEEENRLKEEKVSLHQWFREEWAVVKKALEWSTNEPDVMFQLQDRKEYLLRLYLGWVRKIIDIPNKANVDYNDWGPSAEEIQEAEEYETNESVIIVGGEEIREDEELYMVLSGGDDEIEEELYDEGLYPEEDEAELVDNMELDLEKHEN